MGDDENESVDSAPRVPKVLPGVLFLLTLLALAIGTWFYLPQLSAMPMELWLFVPDCPLYALLGAALVLWHFPRSRIWAFVVGSGLALYGSWTIFVLLLHPSVYFAPDQYWLSAILVAGHLGMIIEGLIVLPKTSTKTMLVIALAWFGLNTYMDYHLGPLSTHPWIPAQNLGTVENFTWAAGIFWPALFFFLGGRISMHPWVRKLHRALCWIC